ncbi:RDD family protein [Marinibactrum halimedae]|nr:RDD family protein [Marinibactrum halimedae]MCD9458534.1 RDD family protein [Marinibactrum halimedae]
MWNNQMWTLLGIEPTSDARAIKRAYAKQLKQNKPDEKPQEFQALYQAKENALAYAKQQQAYEQTKEHTVEERSLIETPVQADTPVQTIEKNAGACNDSNDVIKCTEAEVPSSKQQEEIPNQEEEAPYPEEEPLSNRVYTLLEETMGEKSCEVNTTLDTIVEDEKPPEETSGNGDANAQDALVPSISERKIIFEALLKNTDHLLTQSKKKNDPAQWEFIQHTQFLLDSDFHWALSQAILQRIAQHHHNRKARHHVSPASIIYLNSILQWCEYETPLKEVLGKSTVELVLQYIPDHHRHANETQLAEDGLRGGKLVNKKRRNNQPLAVYYFGSLWKRLLAGSIDLLLTSTVVVTTMMMWKKIHATDGATPVAGIEEFMGIIIGYLIGAFLFEASPMQATPGKSLFGLKVTNKRFKRLNWVHCLWRTFIFTLTLPLSKFIFWINAFLRGNLIHDRLSSSYVLDIHRSEREN